MCKYRCLSALIFATGISAADAAALTPREVLVVGNSASSDSVALARSYAAGRGISPENIVLIETTTKFAIDRDAYERQLLEPIKQLLIDRKLQDQIRCIVLMWGVPVRVMEPPPEPPTPQQLVYRKAADRAHYRLVIARKFLGSVAEEFPEPRTKFFKPLAGLFGSKAPAPPSTLPEFAGLRSDINVLLNQKRKAIPGIDEPRERQIAWRQLMALHLDIRGLKGLAELLASVSPPTAPNIDHVKALLAAAEKELIRLGQAEDTRENIQARLDMINNISGSSGLYLHAHQERGPTSAPAKKSLMSAADASVDSELALMWWPKYRLEGWVDNPLHWQSRLADKKDSARTIMTARIDGPTAADARRIIETSLATEKTGLKGSFYIDAGGKVPAYDVYLRGLHSMVKTHTAINTVLNDKPTVFAPGTCPDAALYVGWYSLRKYVPAFSWKPGAVGWHVASFEAEKLRTPGSQIWCVKMIQNGVAATIGAVAEPLLGAFPKPHEFFGLLLTGKYTLAECYWRTVPSASWRMTLIGDPLYNPFAANPQLRLAQLPVDLRW